MRSDTLFCFWQPKFLQAMQDFTKEEFKQTGTYEIRNLIDGKVYIGSTTMSFQKRWEHHRCLLNKGTHKNDHLQEAWNKHGQNNFIFNIIEVIDECCVVEAEQILLDSVDNKYNINPFASGTPNSSREVIEKRSATFKKTINKAMEYYNKIKEGEISLEDVPEKFYKLVDERLNKTVWNKGLTSEDIDYSFLKGVPKTITQKVLDKRKMHSEKMRNDFGGVHVYDLEFNYLGEFRSPKDIEEWSWTEENNLPIKSRFKGEERRGIPVRVLQAVNIAKSCNHLIPYKGLYFRREKI